MLVAGTDVSATTGAFADHLFCVEFDNSAYLATVDWATSIPSISSSPRIGGAPTMSFPCSSVG